MLQLNTIPFNRNRVSDEIGADRDLVLFDCASHHDDHLLDRLIDLKLIAPWRRFLDVIPYAADNIFCSVGIPYDTA